MCSNGTNAPSILIVDHHDFWRNFAVETLCEAGFNTIGMKNYELPASQSYNLVVLGCDVIGADEAKFLQTAANQKFSVVVVSLEGHKSQMVRIGFLNGALDVLAKPLGKNALLKSMKESLFHAEKSTKQANSRIHD